MSENIQETKLRRILEILEFEDIDEIEKMPMNEIEELFKLYKSSVKSMNRRINQLLDERDDLYERTDMMEFAEYVARLYDLRGMNEWLDTETRKPISKTVNEILNDFEKEKEKASQTKSSNIDGKDFSDIIYGR